MQSVKCAVCSYVTPVVQTSNPQQALQLVQQQQHAAAHLPQQPQHAPPPQSAAGSSKQTQTVLVENPSGIDESGNEVRWVGRIVKRGRWMGTPACWEYCVCRP